MDLRVKILFYNSPKKGVFHDGPIGEVKFDSVQISSGDIDVINLKKENISILDSKIFLKNNPQSEKNILFGKSLRNKGGGQSKIGLSITNKLSKFQILLGQ